MNEWKKYFDDRKRRDHELGFAIIIPNETTTVVPLWCPVCFMLMSTSEDSDYFRSRQCCYRCGLKWADSNREKWNSGWRPERDDVRKEVEFRQSIPVSLNLDVFSR